MQIKKVLIADDDADDREIFERVLGKKTNVRLMHSAENGKEVIDYLGRINSPEDLPNLIILDHNMPKMNGLEFLKVIRADDRLRNIKVFVMTTSGEEGDRRTTEQLGISGYLIKPLNFNNNSKRSDSMDGFVQFHLRKILASKQA